MAGPFVRHKRNPIITPSALSLEVNAVLNPGVAYVDGQIVLLLRLEDKQGISGIHVARSANGVDGWQVDKRPLLGPGLADYPYEQWGCEDPRVTQVAPNRWMIAYTAYSPYGPAVALAETNDFVSAKRLGVVMSPNNKDAAIVPEKAADGVWVMLHRPVTGAGEHIWYACSPDISHWALPGLLLSARGGPWWDGLKIGVGAVPIATDAGWLLIYHGVKDMGGRPVYRLGLSLLARDDPRRMILRASQPVFAPETDYEQRGLVPNVVYTCGAVVLGEEVWMYYGAADTVIGLAVARLSDLIDFVHRHDYLHQPHGYLD